jgi:hypothetical protein
VSTPPKSVLVALKIDAETAAALEALPNRSAFIREALRARMDEVCPLCRGSGRRTAPAEAARGRRHHHALPRRCCLGCGREHPLVEKTRERDREALRIEVERLRHFLAYGDFFCPGCFLRSRDCDRCGHRMAGDETAHVCPY